MLGAVAHSPQQLEIDLEWIKDEIGDRLSVDLIARQVRRFRRGWAQHGAGPRPDSAETKAFLDDLMERYGAAPG